MKRACSGHPCNLDAGFVTHSTCFSSTLPMFSMSGSINHLERVKEGRDLEDDGMQTTMKSQSPRGSVSSIRTEPKRPLIDFATHPMSCCSSTFQLAVVVAQPLSLYSLEQN